MNQTVPLDGNAIGGDLHEVFGVDLTGARAACASCGVSSFVAESVVYTRCPGRVARCRACGEVLIVLVTIQGKTSADIRGIGELQTGT